MTRRRLITTGVAGVAGASGLAVAARLSAKYGLIAPDHGGIYGLGETLTYGAQRVLMSGHSMAREFDRSQITKSDVPVNGDPPRSRNYQDLLAGKFADWRLKIDGMVARPALLSLADIRSYPARTQITHQACEEGWSFIAEWTGVPLEFVLNMVGALPQAKYVVYFAMDESWDSIDMAEAVHPQTLLAYGRNGEDLPAEYGAPLRMRVPRQLGYKSVKYLAQITVTDTLKNIRNGKGSISPDYGYSWYAGI
jgi:DMSO/TMAO reductase YedYZ molybdopterin-dependent catalytic subunit